MAKPKSTQTTTPLFDTNGFTSALVVDAAIASEISYGRNDLDWNALQADGWTNITDQLSFAKGSVVDGYFVNRNAAGIVLEKDGVLFVAFRGTDVDNPLPDMLSYWRLDGADMTARYYADVGAMMDAAMAYAAASDEVTQVVATGHSLGGSAVDAALRAYGADAYPELRGITFNSPTSGLLNDGRELNVGYANDMIYEIVGNTSAPNALHNLYYAIQPGEPMPDPGTETDYIALLSKVMQAWTSPAHDIARFPDALQALADSPIYDMVGRNDVVVLDGSQYAVSLDAMAKLSPSFDKAMAASSKVGLIGQGGDDILGGSRYNDVIDGGAGNDIIVGLGGNDTLWGGGGDDTFIFGKGFGRDVIKDYGPGDVLSFQTGPAGGDYLPDLAAVKAWVDSSPQVRASFKNGDLTISLGGRDSVTLEGVASWDAFAMV
ncbi:hypothetical protein [Caenispirillum bisanense]|uniref:hypothetical protein n=1 Tax=Caenispirillum bisanense TaxID=414052 RepID=UPI0031D77F26